MTLPLSPIPALAGDPVAPANGRQLALATFLVLVGHALLLFGLLGTVMVLTRKLDWYGVGKRKVAEPLAFDLEAVQ